MNFTSIGDLSKSLQTRRDTARLKGDMQRLTNELSSGRKADLRASTRGDLRPLAALERSVALLSSYNTAASEAALLIEVTQDTLGHMQSGLMTLAGTALLANTTLSPPQVDAVGREARQQFEANVARLNVQAAGRSVFAGTATDGPALRPGSEILDALVTAVSTAGATNAADVAAVLDTWFAPGGDFDTFAYVGSPDPLRPAQIGEGEFVDTPVTAQNPAIRDTLRALALGAVLDRGVLAGDMTERAALSVRSGEALVNVSDRLTSLRADVGDAEAVVARAQTRIGAERAAAEIARAGIVEADPYEAASQLLAMQGQLETLYTITGRLSQLTLTNFLR